ncbi:MAG: two pore domain potassium channel family protein [Muribaculaceae bacterium]|nr:two pore domain potassium channel family protein [Muribaculaceae bacterium]
MSDTSSAPSGAVAPAPVAPGHRHGSAVLWICHTVVLVLSVLLIVYISFDTFKDVNFLQNHTYMTFQFWVCVVFMLDFFIEMYYAPAKWRYVKRRTFFLLMSIPYLNLLNMTDLQLSPEALYFVRFIPLARGALALSIVFGYFSKNAITSFFMSYIVILLMVVYFCSLIFYQCEHMVNPQIDTYWTALWWAFMNMSTVGCYINAMTIAGRILAVVLPVTGMIMFPLFTVYLTDYVKRNSRPNEK